MKKIFLLFLFSGAAVLNAQTYSWQWAKEGGATNGSGNSGFSPVTDEMIRDVVVDSENNSYFLSSIFLSNPKLNGNAVPVYGNNDLFLFSLDCQGNVRWTRTIGGNGSKSAWKLAVDNNGGVYLTAVTYSSADSSTTLPIRFGDNDILPQIITPYSPTSTVTDPALNTSFLLKYNSANGALVWRKNLQGNVNWQTRNSENNLWYMDSGKNIHAILGFSAGTHLNGLITVPSTYTTTYQYYLVKFNYNSVTGDMIPAANPLLLPITGNFYAGQAGGKTKFLYDEVLNRYYIAGARDLDFTGQYDNLSYNNVPFTVDGYMIAINGANGAEVWRKEFNTGYSLPDNKPYGLIKDADSNIYLSGYYYRLSTAPAATFGNYTLPSLVSGHTPFVMKMNAAGDVQWTKTTEGYSPTTFTGYRFARGPIVLNGNEIAFVKGSIGDKWGNFQMTRPQNDSSDPLLVRLNKDTGAVLGTNEIQSNYGRIDEMTAVAVDADGNYVVGGFFHDQLFTDPADGVNTLTVTGVSTKSQFFAAKLAKSACSQLSTTEIAAENAQLSFYPNPAHDYVMVSTKNKLQTFEVYSMSGQLVKKGKFENGADRINVQSLASGNYLIKITTDKGSLSGKMIKK